jgi:tRNA(Ile)-lysidine synthase
LPAWGGRLLVDPATRGGLDANALRRAEIRPRVGGERFQRAPRAQPRSLKKAFQELGLGIDHRAGPLVYLGGQLAFVPGLGVDARQQVPDGEAGCRITWRPGD